MDDILPWYGRDCGVRIWSARAVSACSPLNSRTTHTPAGRWVCRMATAGAGSWQPASQARLQHTYTDGHLRQPPHSSSQTLCSAPNVMTRLATTATTQRRPLPPTVRSHPAEKPTDPGLSVIQVADSADFWPDIARCAEAGRSRHVPRAPRVCKRACVRVPQRGKRRAGLRHRRINDVSSVRISCSTQCLCAVMGCVCAPPSESERVQCVCLCVCPHASGSARAWLGWGGVKRRDGAPGPRRHERRAHI